MLFECATNHVSPMTSKKKTIIAGAIVVAVLIVVAVGIGMADVRANTRPDQVVERFYGSWRAALTDGSNGPIAQGLHKKSTYVTETFGNEVARAHEKGQDAVLCGTTDFDNFGIEQSVIREDGSSATVMFLTKQAVGHVILVPDEKGWWRIDEVDCSPIGA